MTDQNKNDPENQNDPLDFLNVNDDGAGAEPAPTLPLPEPPNPSHITTPEQFSIRLSELELAQAEALSLLSDSAKGFAESSYEVTSRARLDLSKANLRRARAGLDKAEKRLKELTDQATNPIFLWRKLDGRLKIIDAQVEVEARKKEIEVLTEDADRWAFECGGEVVASAWPAAYKSLESSWDQLDQSTGDLLIFKDQYGYLGRPEHVTGASALAQADAARAARFDFFERRTDKLHELVLKYFEKRDLLKAEAETERRKLHRAELRLEAEKELLKSVIMPCGRGRLRTSIATLGTTLALRSVAHRNLMDLFDSILFFIPLVHQAHPSFTAEHVSKLLRLWASEQKRRGVHGQPATGVQHSDDGGRSALGGGQGEGEEPTSETRRRERGEGQK